MYSSSVAAVILLFLLLPLSWQRRLPVLLLLCLLRLGFCLDRLFARALTSFLIYVFICSGNEGISLKFPPHDDIEDKDYHDVNVNDASRIRIKERERERECALRYLLNEAPPKKGVPRHFFFAIILNVVVVQLGEVTLCAL